MHRACLLLPLLAALASCGGSGESRATPPTVEISPPPGTESESARARAAVVAYASELKAKLSAALAGGGATGAIEVCHTIAPELARSHGASTGLTLRRVTTRMRNPDAEPDDWELRVLANFSNRLRAGTSPANLEALESTTIDGKPVLRYAKAIVIDPLCLTCHGESIAPPIEQKLRDLYPDDQATGYKSGDLRGIFSVIVPRPAP